MDKITNEGDKEHLTPASVTYEEHVKILEALQKKKKARYHDTMSSIFSKAT
jgi:DNA-binding FadR family transcriptional regulator